METTTRLFVFLTLVIFGLPGHANEDAAPTWTADANGCKVWNARPQTGETVTWSGACKNGYAEGPGFVQWLQDGKLESRIESIYIQGKLNGKATYISANGVRTEGDFIDGVLSGKGVTTWPNGDRYEGNFAHGARTGAGVLELAKGGRFEGDFVDGKWTGKGIYASAAGARYEGEWLDSKREGNGTQKFADGSSYTGHWTQDARTGVGVLERANGDRYEGDFVDGKWTGKGTYTSATGARYEGEWLDSMRNGTGTQVFDDGSRYTGQWKDNKPLNPESIERKTYSMKESVLGSQLKRDTVKNVAVPIDKTFAQLTPQEKLVVKAPYGPMGADDEPPYPLYGLRKSFEASIKLADALRVRGELVLAVNVDSTGQPLSVEVIDSPDKEMTKRMAAVLMLDKYKPAVCSGAPCKKQYWFRMNFVDDL